MSLKNELLKLNFQHDGHLYANSLSYAFTIYHKCLLLRFFVCGIHVPISIPTEVQERTHYELKNGGILLKIALLKSNFQHEGHLYANFLLYILTFYL